MTGKQLTCQEAAVLIGVSVSTIKRMCNDGALEFTLTPGGHRRVSQSSIQQLLKSQSASPVVLPPAPQSADDLLELLLQRQTESLVRYFEQLSLHKTVASVLDDVLVPTLWEIGHRWKTGTLDVYQEHICSETVDHVLDEWARRLPCAVNPHRVDALGCAVGNEQHRLVSKMIALVFRSVGIPSLCLGARVPVASLLKASNAYHPRILWVTYTTLEDLDQAKRDNRTIYQSLSSDQSLVIGGRALTEDVRRGMNFDFFGDSLTHLEHYAMQGKWRFAPVNDAEQRSAG